jgi:hypothetical protein
LPSHGNQPQQPIGASTSFPTFVRYTGFTLT